MRGEGKMPAGKQMVAPFIGLFVGSAMTFRLAMKQAGDSPCVRASSNESTTTLSIKNVSKSYSLALHVSNFQRKLYYKLMLLVITLLNRQTI